MPIRWGGVGRVCPPVAEKPARGGRENRGVLGSELCERHEWGYTYTLLQHVILVGQLG